MTARAVRLWETAQDRVGSGRAHLAVVASSVATTGVLRDEPSREQVRRLALSMLLHARSDRARMEPVSGVREPASSTFHHAATSAARCYAESALLSGATSGLVRGDAAWAGAFALLADLAERARAIGGAR